MVQRVDLDARTDPRAQELALADNRVAELDLDWDPAVLRQLEQAGVALEAFWTPEEFARLLAPEGPEAAARREHRAGPRPPRPRSGAATCFNSAATASRAGTRRRRRTSPGSSPGPPRGLMVTDPPYGVNYQPAFRHHGLSPAAHRRGAGHQ